MPAASSPNNPKGWAKANAFTLETTSKGVFAPTATAVFNVPVAFPPNVGAAVVAAATVAPAAVVVSTGMLFALAKIIGFTANSLIEGFRL